MPLIKLYEGDCLEIMPTLPDKSIDMVLCDLPYGTTACKWDTIIPFEPLWLQYKRLIKDNGVIVLTASQPFTSALVMSNPVWFKYEWIWYKNQPSGFALANKQPMKTHENILVFYNQQPKYNKQLTFSRITDRQLNKKNKRGTGKENGAYGNLSNTDFRDAVLSENVNPRSVLEFNIEARSKGTLHPTQKPVSLFEYLIKTYTNEGDTVLDNCAGSGTTGVACFNVNRWFILIEKNAGYCEIIRQRLAQHQRQSVLSL